jgi:sulfoxide reductase heme-binding subunit YedZ
MESNLKTTQITPPVRKGILDSLSLRLPRLTRLQILVHIGAWIPLAVLILDALNGNLTINPIQEAQIRSGDIAITLLILSLAVTPINMLFKLPGLVKVRRTLGLYAYMYAAIHLAIFVWLDYGFDLGLLLEAVAEKPFIIVGLTTFILLSALALTSFKSWMVRLGKNWKRLHRLVYLANLLVVLHFAWASKGDLFKLQGDIIRPLLAGVAVIFLLVLRIPAVRKRLAGTLKQLVPASTSKYLSEK